MPSPRVLDFTPRQNPAGQAIGQGFSNYFNQLIGEQQERRKQKNIDDLLARIEEGQSEEDVTKAIFGAQGVPFETKQKLHGSIIEGRRKKQTDLIAQEERDRLKKEREDSAKYYQREFGIELPEGELPSASALQKGVELKINKAKQAKANRAIADSLPENIRDKISDEQIENTPTPQFQKTVDNLQKKEDKPSKFKEGLQKAGAAEYQKAQQHQLKLQNSKANIKRADELVNSLSGPTGYAKFGQQAELKDVGFSLIDNILKIFNPSGPIAQKKLQQLADIYAISPYSLTSTNKGKIRAMSMFIQQAEALNNNYMEMLWDYDGAPPPEALAQFEDSYERTLLDPMIQMANNNFEGEVPIGGFYDAAGNPLPGVLTKDKAEELLKKGKIFAQPPVK